MHKRGSGKFKESVFFKFYDTSKTATGGGRMAGESDVWRRLPHICQLRCVIPRGTPEVVIRVPMPQMGSPQHFVERRIPLIT